MHTNRVIGSMLALFFLAGCCLAQGGEPPAKGTPEEPSGVSNLHTCQRYADAFYKKDRPEDFVSLVLSEESFEEEKFEGKVGSQLISTVLSGDGIWKDKSGASSDVRFTCLLENSKTPVYFGILEDGPRDPVDVCWDGFEPSGWGNLTDCLQAALKREEAALAEQLNKTTEQAKQSMDKASALKTLQESNAQWLKYRDGECDRRQAAVAGRNHTDLDELTCKIRKTAERIEDFRFDE